MRTVAQHHGSVWDQYVAVPAYHNAGRAKIYDDAMAWILIGFLMYPIGALHEQWYWLSHPAPAANLHGPFVARTNFTRHTGCGLRASFGAWKTVWKHQMNVWRGL
jgi:hypothetical protein